jgi:ubiquinone/menaquinone biosynthesis C-methylase UbiE
VKDKVDDIRNSNTLKSLEIDAMAGDITDRLAYPDNYFDAVVCCLTLCSVQEQQAALNEIRRLIRPNGGTFGYVEHVAVNPDEPYRFLEWQQTVLDPLQQALADNCHLHRYTEDAISSTFDVPNSAQRISEERFFVNDMWPVSCQCCGVIQREARR